MRLTTFTCDRCGHETTRPRVLIVKEISMKRDLCDDCIGMLREFLIRETATSVQTVYQIKELELQHVYKLGAEALEAYANGASADDMAEYIRDMLSRAQRERPEPEPVTLLGIPV